MLEQILAWFSGFTEAGRALNGKNTGKIKQIHDHAAAMLGMECAGMREAWRSFGENSGAVQKAIEEMHGGCFIQDMWDDHCVYGMYGDEAFTFYDIPYSIDAAGAVTLGTPVPVRPVTTYEPIPAALEEAAADENEAMLEGDCIPLMEAHTSTNGTIPIKIIQPGWGSSGFYSEAVLKRDMPAAFPAGTKMYWNHPTATEAAERPERDLDFLAAKTVSAPTWRADGPAGPGMYAEAQVYDGYADKVASLAPDIGLSIIAQGYAKTGEAEGRSGPIIERIVRGESIDFVTTPGAGGAILTQFAEAARPHSTAPVLQENRPMADTEDLKALREAHDRMAQEVARMKEREITARTRELVSSALNADDELLPITRDRLFEAQIKNPPMADGALDEAALIERVQDAARVEKSYLAATTGSGRITGMGSTVRHELTEADVQQELAGVFGTIGLSESGAALAARGRR